MESRFEREIPLFGEDGINKLKKSSVAVVGLGGVGGYVTEALCRSGVGRLILIDGDIFTESNLNRQLFATCETIGKSKVETGAIRVASINPECIAEPICEMVSEENCARIIGKPDFVCDCCDDTSAKVAIAVYCTENHIPIISCMGTGNKLNPEFLRVSDISKTSVCPLARSFRKKLREKEINHIPVVYSTEEPIVRSNIPASVSFVPGTAGLIMAGYTVKTLVGI